MQTTVARVEVDTHGDGRALVRWELEGAPVAVDVATGPTPDHIDHTHEATVPAGQTELRVTGRDGGRLFVSVSPHGTGPAVVAADRRVPFEGIQNFRDLGGYATRSGEVVRWGLVFRADALHGLSTGDLALYGELGLRVVYDLRRDMEREQLPNPVPSRPLTITGQPPGTEPASLTEDAARFTTADGERFLLEMYLGLLEHSAGQIGELYTGLAQRDGLPAVFHCHGGKDRTGIVAALLLEALGVERETVLDDYELTARYRRREHQESTYGRLREAGLSPEAAAGVLSAPRWAMAQALDDLDRRYGGIETYLTGPAGLAAADLQVLRERLAGPGD
ncbi:MAG TPA: tyrosine-protein phosphatase [Acidimicrobiales bacterium]|nr:tyrosine-protein phosphatase [Acidimicrobiales bacterium]